MQRVTNADIQATFDWWLRAVGGHRAESAVAGENEHNAYKLGGAYGRTQVQRMVPGSSGVYDVSGYLTKRELYDFFHNGLKTLSEYRRNHDA
jgi:hypothetical protein